MEVLRENGAVLVKCLQNKRVYLLVQTLFIFLDMKILFYHLKANFPVGKMKDMARRAYAFNETNDSDKPLKEFIYIDEEPNYDKEYNSMTITYYRMKDLVFGFAPKGMVVVWIGYGFLQKEVGRFQAESVKDDEKYARKLFSKISQTRQDIKNNMFIPDATSELWDNYRQRYNWFLGISSENKNFKAFQIIAHYYNAEKETMLRPWINQPKIEERAIPKEISFFWETGKNEAFEGAVFFDWNKTNEAFKKAAKNSKLNINIASDNNSFKVVLNGQPIEVDSMRIFKSDRKYKDSYK